MNLTEELIWRGMHYQTTIDPLEKLNDYKFKFYLGIDPSASSLTVGNLATLMLVKCFIRHGHSAVLLIGGATGLIGDPDGKKTERNLIDEKTLSKNIENINGQFKSLFKGQSYQLVNNIDWMKDKTYLEFLRDVGKHVPMRQMLARDFVSSRLGESGSGISYAEFSYVLIQAYDFLYLNDKYSVNLQICGSDQWGNSIAGVDLIRRINNKSADVYSAPLILDKTTGQKFSKSEGQAVWLDPKLTSPTKFYQFWINVDDNSAIDYLKIFTELSKDEITKIIKLHKASPSDRIAQTNLAVNVTQLIHGKPAVDQAVEITNILTGKKSIAQLKSPSLINLIKTEIPYVKVSSNLELAEVLVKSGLASSKTEARKLINGQAVSINNIRSEKEILDRNDFINGLLLLRRGKAFKDSALIELKS